MTNLWKLLLKHKCGQELTVVAIAFSKKNIHLNCVCVICGEQEPKVLAYDSLIAKAAVADYVDEHPDLRDIALTPERRVN